MKDLFGKPTKTRFAEFRDWAMSHWERGHGEKPPWGPPEFKCLRTGFKRLEDPKTSWLNFLATEETYFSGHSPKKWVADLGRFQKHPESIERLDPKEREVVMENRAMRQQFQNWREEAE